MLGHDIQEHRMRVLKLSTTNVPHVDRGAGHPPTRKPVFYPNMCGLFFFVPDMYPERIYTPHFFPSKLDNHFTLFPLSLPFPILSCSRPRRLLQDMPRSHSPLFGGVVLLVVDGHGPVHALVSFLSFSTMKRL